MEIFSWIQNKNNLNIHNKKCLRILKLTEVFINDTFFSLAILSARWEATWIGGRGLS